MTTQLSNNDQTYPTLENSEDADLLSNDQESLAQGSKTQGSKAQASQNQGLQNQGLQTQAQVNDPTDGSLGPAGAASLFVV